MMMGLDFEVVPSSFDEWLDDTLPTREVAIMLGLGKARDVAARYPEVIVIGGDTIVTVDGTQLGKAETPDEAREMLRGLAGKPHTVTTSVVVLCATEQYEFAEADETKVIFKPYDEMALDRYIASGDWQGKAGAYGIQSGAAPLIDHIEGDIQTVIGLPTRLLLAPLAQLGITARPALYQVNLAE